MRESEFAIVFKSANPGVKRTDEEKKAPRSKLRKMLAVGRRASDRGSAALNAERSRKIASLLFVNDTLLDVFRTKVGCLIEIERTISNGKPDRSN